MSDQIIIAIITSTASVVGTIIAASTKKGQNFTRYQLPKLLGRKSEMSIAIKNNIEIGKYLDLFETEIPGIRKAVIIEITNGGGIPRGGRPLYGTIVLPMRWRYAWDKQQLDEEYLSILEHLLEHKKYCFYTKDLVNEGTLQRMFIRQTVEYCETYFLQETRESLLFLAIDYTNREVGLQYEDTSRRYITKIKNLIT